METFTIRAGSAQPLVVQPQEPDGSMPDLTGASAQIRIAHGGACMLVDGVVVDDGFQFDLSQIDLPSRLFRASVYFDWGEGWIYQNEFGLYFERGC